MATSSTRRFDLDWLRVLLILTVFVYHCTRFFDTGFWHVKNPVTYPAVDTFMAFIGSWLMPLIFIVSGASLFFALGKAATTGGSDVRKGNPALGFIADKAQRLGVPLVVGIFTHVMYQVYLEKITHQEFSGTFWQFIPVYFKGWYGLGGNFAWMGLHLWYLLMLLLFTLALYPLFLLLRGPARRGLDALTRFLALPGAMYLLAVPTMLTVALVDQQSLLGRRDWGGWSILAHLWFFLSGFVIVSSKSLQARIQQHRWISTVLGVTCLGCLIAFYVSRGEPVQGTSDWQVFWGLMGLLSWSWILAWLGHSMTHLNYTKPILRYANEAVLPFYVLHQSVILTVGHVVVRWPIPDLAKFMIIAVSSFAIIMGLYEFLIRRVNVPRFLFGMRALPKRTAAVSAPRVATGPAGGA